MHELGIVFKIIEDVEDAAAANNLRRVSSVTLQLGEVSGIVPELLSNCWRWACDRNDLMRGCALELETIPAVTHCEACGTDYPTVVHGRTCPHCGSERTYLIQGNETLIKEIVTPDDAPSLDVTAPVQSE